ncbi:MAG: TonB-dependent receptor, partial [Candidatus Kryptoniota bacterium]
MIEVPAGSYRLKVTYVGYRPTILENLEVNAGMTTHLTVYLEGGELRSEAVEVFASRPLVRKDETSTVRIYSGSEINNSVGVYSVSDLFRLQPGAIVIPVSQSITLPNGRELQLRDESVKDVHIRGGRGGELLFLVDGMPVTHPIYGGRDVLNLDISDVQQVQMVTGAFDAEYGQAQSGVVSVTTMAPPDSLKISLDYKSDKPLEFANRNAHNFDYVSLTVGSPFKELDYMLEKVGLKSYNSGLFLSTHINMSNTPYDNGRHRSMWYPLGLKMRERQENEAGLNVKLTSSWGMAHADLAYDGSWIKYSPFNWLWHNYPDHMADYSRTDNYFYLTLTNALSNKSFISLGVSYLAVKFGGSLNGKAPVDFWQITRDSVGKVISLRSTVHGPTVDPSTGFYDSGSFETIWRDDNTKTLTIKADFSSQVESHLLKTGLIFQYNDLRYIDIEDGGIVLSPYGQFVYDGGPQVPAPPGPFKAFGQNRWVFHSFPLIGGAYVQDKFEKEFMVMNVGLRLDWFTPGKSVFDPSWVSQWKAATGLSADWKRFRYKVSPRFGVSFPISTSSVTYFSYGHFYQLPEMQFFYRDPYSGGITGNPGLDYQETILYEFGFTSQVGKGSVVDLKLFNREMSKQVGSTQLKAALGTPVSVFDNNGYAHARGLEMSFEHREGRYTSSRISYVIQWASG